LACSATDWPVNSWRIFIALQWNHNHRADQLGSKMNADLSQLARILENDSGIPQSYRHRPKLVVPGAVIESRGATLKWYGLYPQQELIPEDITHLAHARLTTLPLEARGLGFVILHRCAQDFYFLIVCTWRNANELWETVFYKDGATMHSFESFPRDAAHKPVFCVWEMVPVWHEQLAWRRFLASARDLPASQAWLSDVYTGPA
jgi:hypothetical protein